MQPPPDQSNHHATPRGRPTFGLDQPYSPPGVLAPVRGPPAAIIVPARAASLSSGPSAPSRANDPASGFRTGSPPPPAVAMLVFREHGERPWSGPATRRWRGRSGLSLRRGVEVPGVGSRGRARRRRVTRSTLVDAPAARPRASSSSVASSNRASGYGGILTAGLALSSGSRGTGSLRGITVVSFFVFVSRMLAHVNQIQAFMMLVHGFVNRRR